MGQSGLYPGNYAELPSYPEYCASIAPRHFELAHTIAQILLIRDPVRKGKLLSLAMIW